ncbi:MAG: hypothetical protein ABI641_02600, partial [Caldimonas sp.]
MTTHPLHRFFAWGPLVLRGGVGILGMALVAALLAACGGNDYQVALQSAPTISGFAGTPAAVPVGGGQVLLSWSALDATTLTLDNGVGDVSGLSSKSVNVTANTTFTLTAGNATGTTTATTAVTVAT